MRTVRLESPSARTQRTFTVASGQFASIGVYILSGCAANERPPRSSRSRSGIRCKPDRVWIESPTGWCGSRRCWRCSYNLQNWDSGTSPTECASSFHTSHFRSPRTRCPFRLCGWNGTLPGSNDDTEDESPTWTRRFLVKRAPRVHDDSLRACHLRPAWMHGASLDREVLVTAGASKNWGCRCFTASSDVHPGEDPRRPPLISFD